MNPAPQSSQRVSPESQPGGPSPAGIRRLRILVVDDRATTRQVIAARLRLDGHQVQTVENGVDALDHFKQGTWDVVLTDRKMAGIDGEELTVAIKAIDPAMPVILVTGYSEQLSGAPFDMIIRKPFPHETLQAALVAVCP